MSQPIKKNVVKNNASVVNKKKKKVARSNTVRRKRKHTQEYGTSKLEERFARDFLDKLGVEYIYQFKAESIGRYYDFMLPYYRIIIEIDGDYYHSFGVLYENMSPMQKKNKRVDEQKDHWAIINGFKMIRIWEHDINRHPENVMEILKKEMHLNGEKQNKLREKKKRH